MRNEKAIDGALYMCDLIRSPDAHKAEGEVCFWFQSNRLGLSRKLWTEDGFKAIQARIASTTKREDLECLDRLRREAIAHDVVYEWCPDANADQ